eukprot:TRINITY_DN273_c2_g3_i1.p1 TRINITY_DN273_c2_g3~~TRINITY_DN273_c2_g3_i1.p1  ORF type:complete len:435 (+),score=179.51 TRINITY_DN273_c2_g3_i1:89-1393(+)
MSISINSPLTLKCGITLPNRICKAAMTENFANPITSLPNEKHFTLYSRWSQSGAAILITGNIMVDRRYLEAPCNVVIDYNSKITEFRKLADVTKSTNTLLIVQLSHAGRQSPISVTWQPIAPSPVRLNLKYVSALYRPPREMTNEEIEDVINRFVFAAKFCEEAGFNGVEIHAAHGYLLSQFLSPLTNRRNDKWGGSAENRRRLLLEIVKRVRKECNSKFIVSVKVNSADFQRGGFTEEESMDVIRELDKLSIDFIEISGGTYENPVLLNQNVRSSTLEREAFFIEFAEKIRKQLPNLTLLLTGGFRTLDGMNVALSKRVIDIIGIARPLCLELELPKQFMQQTKKEALSYRITLHPSLQIFEVGLCNLWHQRQMYRIATNQQPDLNVGYFYCLTVMLFKLYIFEPKRSFKTTLFLLLIFCILIFYILKCFSFF